MLDFTSALYLGFRHRGRAERSWSRLTTGVPAALADPPGARELSADLAALLETETATLAPSTLHLAWDLFDLLADDRSILLMDAETYPISRWGAERAEGRGRALRTFTHHDAHALAAEARQARRAGRRPIVITDGFCPGCGRSAPLREYLAVARAHQGLLVLDDTQALGVLGKSPTPAHPYGLGGGGSLVRQGLAGPDIIAFASLAKGLGVPVAVLGASRERVRQFEDRAETRIHCSPPSAAVIQAAKYALRLNVRAGEALREGLARRVTYFRRRLADLGIPLCPGLFPVQSLDPVPHVEPALLHSRLRRRGVRTVLHRAHHDGAARVSFVITVRHTLDDLDHAADHLAASIHFPAHLQPPPRAALPHEIVARL